MPPTPRIALAITDTRMLNRLAALPELKLGAVCRLQGIHSTALLQSLKDQCFDALHFGNEFCERLLPSSRSVEAAVNWAKDRQLAFCLVTPALADQGLEQLRTLLPLLPPNTPVICNDYGVIELLLQEFNALLPIAGRQLNKVLKDPRLPNADWAQAVPTPNRDDPAWLSLMQSLGVTGQEIDLRPWAEPTDLIPGALPLAIHFPYAYVLKGRICRIGGLHAPTKKKFAPGQNCRHECLTYFCRKQRAEHRLVAEPDMIARGNSLFQRYTDQQEQLLGEALSQGKIQRLVFFGDWHEDRRAH